MKCRWIIRTCRTGLVHIFIQCFQTYVGKWRVRVSFYRKVTWVQGMEVRIYFMSFYNITQRLYRLQKPILPIITEVGHFQKLLWVLFGLFAWFYKTYLRNFCFSLKWFMLPCVDGTTDTRTILFYCYIACMRTVLFVMITLTVKYWVLAFCISQII